ncbi:MAG: hypothetical protein J1E16_00580 [Muribaculaceae bacterium]|nr:hypothetical protein [Muribaculaceae bacterium]
MKSTQEKSIKESWILFHFDKKQRRHLLNTVLKNINSKDVIKSNDSIFKIEKILNSLSETSLTFSDIFPYSEKKDNTQVVLDTYIDVIQDAQKSLMIYKKNYMTSSQMKVLETIGQNYSYSSILIFSIERKSCGRVIITNIHVIENEDGEVKTCNISSRWRNTYYNLQILYMDTILIHHFESYRLDFFKEILRRGRKDDSLLKNLNTSVENINRYIKQIKEYLFVLKTQMDSYVMCKAHTDSQRIEVLRVS